MLTITFCLEDGPKRYSKQRLFFHQDLHQSDENNQAAPLGKATSLNVSTHPGNKLDLRNM